MQKDKIERNRIEQIGNQKTYQRYKKTEMKITLQNQPKMIKTVEGDNRRQTDMLNQNNSRGNQNRVVKE